MRGAWQARSTPKFGARTTRRMASPLTAMGNTMEQQKLARKNRSFVWNMLSLKSLFDTQWRCLVGNKKYESGV